MVRFIDKTDRYLIVYPRESASKYPRELACNGSFQRTTTALYVSCVVVSVDGGPRELRVTDVLRLEERSRMVDKQCNLLPNVD